eukprot:1013874-Pelagomonas_calceolata.AAC.1
MLQRNISKGALWSFIVGIDTCNKLWSLDMEVPNDVQRSVTNWLFPFGQPPQMQISRPDGILVLPLEGRISTHSPKYNN